MSDRKIEEALRRMAGQGTVGGITVAAPMNDAQLVAVLAAIIYAGNRDAMTEPGQPVGEAIELVAAAMIALKGGALRQAIEQMVGANGATPEPAESN